MSAHFELLTNKTRRFYQFLETLPPKRLALLLVLLGFLFSLLGLSGGTFLISRQETIVNDESALNRVEKRPSVSDVAPLKQDDKVSFSGWVEKTEEFTAENPKYNLLDEKEQVITPLMAEDDKLLLTVGSKVEVVGEMVDSQSGVKTLRVSEVIFK